MLILINVSIGRILDLTSRRLNFQGAAQTQGHSWEGSDLIDILLLITQLAQVIFNLCGSICPDSLSHCKILLAHIITIIHGRDLI